MPLPRAQRQLGRQVIHHQPPARLDRDNLATATELPIERPPGHRVSEHQAFVPFQLTQMLRRAMPGKIARRRTRQDARLQQLAGHQPRQSRFAEPNRDVETFGNQLAQCVAHHQFN